MSTARDVGIGTGFIGGTSLSMYSINRLMDAHAISTKASKALKDAGTLQTQVADDAARSTLQPRLSAAEQASRLGQATSLESAASALKAEATHIRRPNIAGAVIGAGLLAGGFLLGGD